MLVYSSLLLMVVVGGAPWWLARMAVNGRYRAGLPDRLGRVPPGLRAAAAEAHRTGRPVIWLHGVSVGEVLAATRLVEELRVALPGVVVAVSTTTETGQRLARERFAGAPVFYLPLDFAVLMRRYLRVLRPRIVVLMESELWPNMLRECSRAGVPVAVANARVSDRSFPRYMRLRWVWGPLLHRVSVFLAQSEETAARLRAMGVAAERVSVAGNLKYDVRSPRESRMAELVREAAAGRPIVVAGSTVSDKVHQEEAILMRWWPSVLQMEGALLVMAPRHPDRFADVYSVMEPSGVVKATALLHGEMAGGKNILLDTIGDLAAVYAVADVAFLGGSLVRRGGHNPLEAARFGVPVIMGPHFENFREVVEQMRKVDGICILDKEQQLDDALTKLLTDRERAKAMGGRGRAVFEAQSGATGRVVAALVGLIR